MDLLPTWACDGCGAEDLDAIHHFTHGYDNGDLCVVCNDARHSQQTGVYS